MKDLKILKNMNNKMHSWETYYPLFCRYVSRNKKICHQNVIPRLQNRKLNIWQQADNHKNWEKYIYIANSHHFHSYNMLGEHKFIAPPKHLKEKDEPEKNPQTYLCFKSNN